VVARTQRTGSDVNRLVVGQGRRLLAFGLLLAGLLYETSPCDFITYATVVPVLTVAATPAMLFPAIQAAAFDPLIARRRE
jgi:hypothetical protein